VLAGDDGTMTERCTATSLYLVNNNKLHPDHRPRSQLLLVLLSGDGQ
jgi:hypothetical protein